MHWHRNSGEREVTRVPTANGVWLLRLLAAANGMKRTNGTGLTMSVLEGKPDFPLALPDFSV